MAPLNDHPELSPLSLLRTLWRQKWCIGIIWAVVAVGTAVVAYRLPVTYRAEAMILVESQKIPEKFVSATVGTDLQERLNRISQQILSSRQLMEIVQEFDLYHEQRRVHSQDEIVQMMRGDITIATDGRVSRDRPGSFHIAYQGPVPATLAKVANRLGSLFIDENLRTRAVQAEGTSEFLEEQLSQAKARLEEQEARLSQYKMRYNGELPQQETSLLATVNQLQVQLQGVQDSIGRAEQNRIMLQNSVDSANSSFDTMSQSNAMASAQETSAAAAAPAEARALSPLELARQDLDRLRLRYKDSHPDVRRARAEVARLERQQAENPAPTPAPTKSSDSAASGKESASAALRMQMSQNLIHERERVDNLKSQLAAAARQIQSLQADRTKILQTIGSYQGRLSKLPIREQEMAGVSRDYEISKATYQSLLDKKLSSDLATDMEKEQKPERFTMLDAARVPEKPIKPDRPVLIGIGTTFGLLLGLVVGVGRQFAKNVVLGEWELPPGVTVLGRVPLIAVAAAAGNTGAAGDDKAKWKMALVSTSIVLVLGMAVAAGVYFGHLQGGSDIMQSLWKRYGQNL